MWSLWVTGSSSPGRAGPTFGYQWSAEAYRDLHDPGGLNQQPGWTGNLFSSLILLVFYRNHRLLTTMLYTN